MNGSRTRRKYDRDFKLRAVKLVVGGGRPAAKVARELGIHANMLHRWKHQFLNDQEHSFPGKGHLKPQDEEVRRLRRELVDITEERDILKKAVAIFSKHPE